MKIIGEKEIEIPDIPGLNIENALRRFNNKKELYLNILEKFYLNYRQSCSEIRKKFEEEDFNTAYRLVHTLKGLIGSIGANNLFALAELVENSIEERDHKKFIEEIKKLDAAMQELFSNITAKLDFSVKIKTGSINIELLKKIIPNFKQCLKENNPNAKALLKDMESAGLFGAVFDELVNKTNKYDFENAIILTDKIEETLNLNIMKSLFENTILIVDDSLENIDILAELLEDFDKKIAVNGENALKTAFEGEPPDLILLDIIMPEMDGYEVCRRLRANKRTKDIPVIFLTVKTLKDDIVKGFEAGGQDYITKPFDARELMERVKTQLELKTQREILKNMNVVLEKKVQEKTAELDKANKKLEKANLELQGLDIAKNNFLMMISHELRTPLNGIVGISELLKDYLDENSEFSAFVNILEASVDRLERFSTTALDITQLQTGYKLSKKSVDMVELTEQCIANNEEDAKKKRISIYTEVVKKGMIVEVEKKIIKRAINNIINNSIKYTGEGKMIRLKLYADGDKKILEVIDEGSGFTQQALENLFRPFCFYDEHSDENLGLSLKATKHIMEAHNGEIKVENLDEGGTSVRLIFP